mgnify:FL=1|tara:strand:- start:1258 stop:2883 length:1626 start_codon:yes stop_codon:yes gene_type:complete
MSGGKGGSTSSSVTVPEYIEKAAQRNLNKAERISQTGYTPYYGPDVAAFSPMQQASFQNTANVANAFGMGAPTSQQDIMGGMPPPTQYAGGVSGYSSAPLYEQSLEQLGLNRPAQKAHIDSFFINPYTGQPGSNAPAPIDYNAYPTYEEMQRNIAAENSAAQASALVAGDNEGREANEGGGLSVNPDIDYTDGFTASNGRVVGTLDSSYDPNFSGTTYSASPFEIGSSTAGTNYATYDESQGFTAPGVLGMVQNVIAPRPKDDLDASFQNPNTTSIASMGYDVGEVDPRLAAAAGYTDQTKLREDDLAKKAGDYGIFSGRGTDGQGNFGAFGDVAGAVGDMTGFTNYNTPDVVAQREAAEAQRIASERAAREASIAQAAAQRDQDADNRAQLMEKASATRAGVGSNAYTSVEDRKGSQGYTGSTGGSKSSNAAGGGGGTQSNCVIATHAVASGGFSPSSKREAVIWCVNVLHGKWWGEAIRRGYRHLGVKKIEQGKAHEHYAEFKNYIAFARGKNRTIKGALHFAARTAQFFVIGLVKKDI